MTLKNTFKIFILISCLSIQPLFAGNILIYGEPIELARFSLLDQDGKPFTKASLEKQWSLLFFGYTSCPDVCPVTLSTLQSVMGLIKAKPGANKLPVKVVFVSLDPVRDTPQKLKAYIEYFGDDFRGVTAKSDEEIDKLTDSIGLDYDYEDSKTNEPIDDPSELSPERDYLVNHFAGVFIADPLARVSAVVFPPEDKDRLANIFSFIRQSYKESSK